MRPATLTLAAYNWQQFVYYANRVPVIFSATYADTEENRAAGRVGKSHGFRQGVRNLAFVPQEYHPASPQAAPGPNGPVRYFWLTRNKWRAFRQGNLTSITAWWSVKQGRYVGTPQEAEVDAFPEFGTLTSTGPGATNATRANSAAATRRRFTQEQRARTQNARQTTAIQRIARRA